MDDEAVLTVSDLAKLLKCHRATVHRLLQSGELRGFKLGAARRFNREEIERWMNRRAGKNERSRTR